MVMMMVAKAKGCSRNAERNDGTGAGDIVMKGRTRDEVGMSECVESEQGNGTATW